MLYREKTKKKGGVSFHRAPSAVTAKAATANLKVPSLKQMGQSGEKPIPEVWSTLEEADQAAFRN